MKDLGNVKRILGIEIKRNRKEETLSPSKKFYVLKPLEKFAMSGPKNVSLLLAKRFKL